MNLVTRLLNYKYEDILKHIRERKENEIYVTELVECPMKREFRKQLWFLEMMNPSTLLGELVHIGIENIIKKLFSNNNVETEVEVEKRFGEYIIRGRIDAIIDNVIYEFKYMRGIKGELPLPHHVEQLQIYGWITGLDEGVIVYITPNGFKEYEFELTYNDDNISMLVLSRKKPRYDWECSYCAFSDYCPYSNLAKRGGKK